MYVLRCRNVNEAYAKGVPLILNEGKRATSRAGDVIALEEPLTVVYECPWERVLFDQGRNANPFFGVAESLWYLAGRNDARWLDRFVSDFSARFAEDDGTQHGSYGFRWRKHFDVEGGGHEKLPDQLEIIIDRLSRDWTDRRSVLQMWDPVADLGADKRDLPCNQNVMFRVRENAEELFLDMTVTNRSNDFVWGLTGANAVHFSILQEYMALRMGYRMGRYYQIANNVHIYEKTMPPTPEDTPVSRGEAYPNSVPLGVDSKSWDSDLQLFMEWMKFPLAKIPEYINPWFEEVATPLMRAHTGWKAGFTQGYDQILTGGDDWTIAAKLWLDRRAEAKKAKGL